LRHGFSNCGLRTTSGTVLLVGVFNKILNTKRDKHLKNKYNMSHIYLPKRSFAGNIMEIFSAVSQSFKFQLFRIQKKIVTLNFLKFCEWYAYENVWETQAT
jgi:hypothetical protein